MSVNKFYHIVLLGNVGTLVTNQVSNCLFFFDWGQLPKSRWKVYLTANIGTANYTTNQSCMVCCDLGQQEVELARNYTGFYSGSSQADKNKFVGTFLNPSNRGTLNVFQINSYSNPPIYLDTTPTNNSFIQTLRNHGAVRNLFTPNTTTDRIILSMEQLDDQIPRSIKTSYPVVFNSSVGTMNSFIGNYSYYFDWTTIPEGEYLVNMSFITNANSENEIKYAGNSIFIDLGQYNQSVFFASNQANFNIVNKNFVGMTLYSGINTLGQGACFPLYSNSNTTKPIYLKSRPKNNNVNIQILSDYSGQFPLNMNDDTLYNYTLVLYFNLLR
jgi:hypothetical protein